MPVYNSACYLAESVHSVLDSSLKDLELILVDDGSHDGSGEICDRLANEDHRIQVVHKPNGGVSSARNKGLDIANGTFVAFVDSDDRVTSEMYEKLTAAISQDIDIVFCNILLHYHDVDLATETFRPGQDRIQTIRNLLTCTTGYGPWNLIVRRDLVGGLRFPENIRCGEDLWFTLRIVSDARSIAKVEEPLYIYNQENIGSITHSSDRRLEESFLQGMRENRSFLEEAGLFGSVKSTFFWSVLRYKSRFALDPDRIDLYRTVFPDANKYVLSCPFLSIRVKIIMIMLDLHFDAFVRFILHRFSTRQ